MWYLKKAGQPSGIFKKGAFLSTLSQQVLRLILIVFLPFFFEFIIDPDSTSHESTSCVWVNTCLSNLGSNMGRLYIFH